MAFVVVVRREEPELFAYLQQHFQEPEVRVVLDRRQGERRRAASPEAPERRRADRRGVVSADDPLWRYGFRVAVAQAG